VSIAYSLNGLALIQGRRKDYPGALAYFERALEILEENFGEESLDVAGVMNNMAALLNDSGNKDRALATLQRSVTIQEKVAPRNPALAYSLNNLAYLLSQRTNFVAAQDLFRRSLAISDAAFGPDNPDSCLWLDNLGIIELQRGDWDKGLSILVEAARRRRRFLVTQLVFRRSRGVTQFQNTAESSRNWLHSVCNIAQTNLFRTFAVAGAEELALGKALAEEAQITSSQLALTGGVEVDQLQGRAEFLRRRLETIAAPADSAQWMREMQDKSSAKAELERELKAAGDQIADLSDGVKRAVRERHLTLMGIAQALPNGSALVDFVQYRRTQFIGGDDQWKEQRYACYVTVALGLDSTNVIVERFDLGEAQPIDAAVDVIVRRMSAGQYRAKDLQSATETLSQLVYAPLAKHMENVWHLLICPDGQLSRVPFEMLFDGNKRLIETKTISYLGSGREVVRLASKDRKKAANASVVVGNPDFDADLAAEAPQAVAHSNLLSGSLAMAPATRLSRAYQGGSFPPLPKAAEEARFVAATLGSNCVLRLGAEARERDLKAVQSPRVLHLATHGFFLSDQELKRMPSILGGLVSGERAVAPSPDDWESPLLRCGIALAGANHAMQATNSVEDGLLTGQEAALLNLQGTELVILSACNTGTGQVKIGEGVMSLRRAFRIAGVETVIASHWPVSDLAARLLMTEFMRRWRSGEPRAQAWREAQLSLLHSKELASPYFWAAFTLTGKWD
jgi:CHAT domain-containing protein